LETSRGLLRAPRDRLYLSCLRSDQEYEERTVAVGSDEDSIPYTLPTQRHILALLRYAVKLGDDFVLGRLKIQFIKHDASIQAAFAWAEEDCYLTDNFEGQSKLTTLKEAMEFDEILEHGRRREFSDLGPDGEELRGIMQAVAHRAPWPLAS
jgi:hypothetical protein